MVVANKFEFEFVHRQVKYRRYPKFQFCIFLVVFDVSIVDTLYGTPRILVHFP